MKRLLPLILLMVSYSSFAQTGTGQTATGPTPAQTLRLARATYEQGRLHEIPTQLSNEVIGSMTNKQDKVEAYKILCLSYIYLEEPDEADNAMLNILRTDPYFEINEAVDPAEFVALYKTFRTNAIYRIGATLGVNGSQPNVINMINTDGSIGKYSYKFGIQFGASAEMPINRFFDKRFTLHADILYHQKKFELTTEKDQGDGDLIKLTALESQTWLSLPVTIQYNFWKNKFNPYIALGASADLILNSSISAIRLREGETSVEEKRFNLDAQRNALNMSAVAALGGKLRVAGGYLIGELRYTYGLTQVNNDETAYENQDLSLTYGLPNSTFKVNSLAFSFSYVQNIFKPKKLRVTR
jgi:Outer membrane protein beta-barrel domain